MTQNQRERVAGILLAVVLLICVVIAWAFLDCP